MKHQLFTPEIEHYIWRLGERGLSNSYCNSYDEKSLQQLDELFQLIKQIAPISDNGVREIWLTSERGPIERYGDYEELLADGDVSSYDEFEQMWKEEYPDEISWHNFTAIEDESIGYRAVFLNHRFVIEQDYRKEKGYPHNISEFTEWLVDSVRSCIQELGSGGYNERVERDLPPQHRTGIIKRKDYWDIFPDCRESFFENTTPDEIKEFLHNVSEQQDDPEFELARCESMTANDFFSYCAIGYKANEYPGTELTTREQYLKHADGRDEGLTDIESDSPCAFYKWLTDTKRYGGHPFEVCRGGNSTNISLYVLHDEKGYYLFLAGSAWNRTIETVKFFNALKRAGVPVYLREAEELSARLTEDEEIGIVPEGIIPAYCHNMFPGMKVIDFMNLPHEDRTRVAEKAQWLPLTKVSLLR